MRRIGSAASASVPWAASRYAHVPEQVTEALQRMGGDAVAGGDGLVAQRLGPVNQPLVVADVKKNPPSSGSWN
jgi:hypothetical protein